MKKNEIERDLKRIKMELKICIKLVSVRYELKLGMIGIVCQYDIWVLRIIHLTRGFLGIDNV
jgi:hypothetical protein